MDVPKNASKPAIYDKRSPASHSAIKNVTLGLHLNKIFTIIKGTKNTPIAIIIDINI